MNWSARTAMRALTQTPTCPCRLRWRAQIASAQYPVLNACHLRLRGFETTLCSVTFTVRTCTLYSRPFPCSPYDAHVSCRSVYGELQHTLLFFLTCLLYNLTNHKFSSICSWEATIIDLIKEYCRLRGIPDEQEKNQ